LTIFKYYLDYLINYLSRLDIMNIKSRIFMNLCTPSNFV
jgi:hypothetical protein